MATTAKDELSRLIDADRDHPVRLSHRIHADPELGFEEDHASALLADHTGRQGLRKRLLDGDTMHSAKRQETEGLSRPRRE